MIVSFMVTRRLDLLRILPPALYGEEQQVRAAFRMLETTVTLKLYLLVISFISYVMYSF